MFLSKIWFFLIAVAAAAAITVALVMPRPAERTELANQKQQVERACSVADILLRDNAGFRIQLAGDFARSGALGDILATASKGEIISGEISAKGRKALGELLDGTKGAGKPDFAILVDTQGRVVARAGLKDESFGDSMRGYFLIDDALDGYLRDDLWSYKETLYRVAASPVVTTQLNWAGAVVLGHAVDKEFADKLGGSLNVHISFYVAGKTVASNTAISLHDELVAHFDEISKLESEDSDCSRDVFTIETKSNTYNALVARLPGEAGEQKAFYSVFVEQPAAIGFLGTFDAVTKDDMSFDKFPWINIGALFLVIVIIGMGLMYLESDRPLRRLNKDAIGMAKDGKDRLEEERHRGKYGSIARSVNIAIDKLNREAKAAKKDLDQLMGPGLDDASSSLPGMSAAQTTSPSAAPPPSEFKFSSASSSGVGPAPASPAGFSLDLPKPPPGMSAAPSLDLPKPPPPAKKDLPPPPPPSVATKPPSPVDDFPSADVLAVGEQTMIQEPTDELLEAAGKDNAPAAGNGSDDAYFKEIFDDFIALKTKCGESTANLTLAKFSKKLVANRKALISKHGCKSVKFQVYIKDGKAALKASPVKS